MVCVGSVLPMFTWVSYVRKNDKCNSSAHFTDKRMLTVNHCFGASFRLHAFLSVVWNQTDQPSIWWLLIPQVKCNYLFKTSLENIFCVPHVVSTFH